MPQELIRWRKQRKCSLKPLTKNFFLLDIAFIHVGFYFSCIKFQRKKNSPIIFTYESEDMYLFQTRLIVERYYQFLIITFLNRTFPFTKSILTLLYTSIFTNEFVSIRKKCNMTVPKTIFNGDINILINIISRTSKQGFKLCVWPELDQNLQVKDHMIVWNKIAYPCR